jgi:uncharacterized repeat protein (TIGR03837 family)
VRKNNDISRLSIDLFCRVVDNFGDIGVCWRLARQLARDDQCDVRLFVDDFQVFKKIERNLDPGRKSQVLNGVTILPWNEPWIETVYTAPGDAVIEAFACTLPDHVVNVMVRSDKHPVWIDLEYLSAEDWVDNNHAIVSCHPMTGLNKTLFFPGFTEKTGGLIRERNLIRERDDFQSSPDRQNTWRVRNGLPELSESTLDVSLFCYGDAPFGLLMDTFGQSEKTVRLFVPERAGGESLLQTVRPPNVLIHPLPFLHQDDYDRLLWTCGLNFVRGEDSFVRALWAGKPMVWHIYPQDGRAHFVKLEAFLRRYARNLPPGCADPLEKFMVLWNERGRRNDDISLKAGSDWIALLPRLTVHAAEWARKQAGQDDLATRLIRFIRRQKETEC